MRSLPHLNLHSIPHLPQLQLNQTFQSQYSTLTSFLSSMTSESHKINHQINLNQNGNQTRNITNMPKLPIPPLDQSVNLYLKSIIPFLLQSTEKSSERNQFEKEYQMRKEWANELCAQGGLGQRLQERLIDVDRSSTYNWLDDNYWIKIAYHSNRVPLPINSNWWILIQPDSDIPNQVIESLPEKGRFTDWQLRRASVLVNRTMIFKQKLDSQEIIPESSRAGRFCMHQYDCPLATSLASRQPIWNHSNTSQTI